MKFIFPQIEPFQGIAEKQKSRRPAGVAGAGDAGAHRLASRGRRRGGPRLGAGSGETETKGPVAQRAGLRLRDPGPGRSVGNFLKFIFPRIGPFQGFAGKPKWREAGRTAAAPGAGPLPPMARPRRRGRRRPALRPFGQGKPKSGAGRARRLRGRVRFGLHDLQNSTVSDFCKEQSLRRRAGGRPRRAGSRGNAKSAARRRRWRLPCDPPTPTGRRPRPMSSPSSPARRGYEALSPRSGNSIEAPASVRASMTGGPSRIARVALSHVAIARLRPASRGIEGAVRGLRPCSRPTRWRDRSGRIRGAAAPRPAVRGVDFGRCARVAIVPFRGGGVGTHL